MWYIACVRDTCALLFVFVSMAFGRDDAFDNVGRLDDVYI